MSDRPANGPARTPRTSGFVRSGPGGACVRHRKRTPIPMGGARFGMRGGGLGRERQAAGCMGLPRRSGSGRRQGATA